MTTKPKSNQKKTKTSVPEEPVKVQLEVESPIDGVQRVTELEAAKFAALDAELRNTLQGIRILDLETETAENNLRSIVARHQSDQAQRQSQKKMLEGVVGTKRDEYTLFVKTLAATYDLDPTKMSIDPETRTLRDLRGDTGNS
jgi:hypothetical protein